MDSKLEREYVYCNYPLTIKHLAVENGGFGVYLAKIANSAFHKSALLPSKAYLGPRLPLNWVRSVQFQTVSDL